MSGASLPSLRHLLAVSVAGGLLAWSALAQEDGSPPPTDDPEATAPAADDPEATVPTALDDPAVAAPTALDDPAVATPTALNEPPAEPKLLGPIPALDALVTVPKFGEFRIRLDRDRVPNHVATFLSLAASGAYDSLGFHRVIPDFLVQTGDPSSRDDDPGNDGSTHPSWRIPAEPTEATHRRGTVSMAWSGDDPGSAASQWFVTLIDSPQLDGHATPIGEVVEGMDVVDRVAQVTTLRNRHPLRRLVLESVRLVPIPVEAIAADAGPP